MAILQSDGVNNATDLILRRNGTEALRLTDTGTVQLTSVNDGPLAGNRNRIMNGDMLFNQRGVAPATFGAGGAYILDRWIGSTTIASNMQISRPTDSPVGFIYSQKATALTGAVIGASDFFVILQRIEGHNISDFKFGTASAITATLSFLVKSSVTGTHSGALRNNDITRSRPFTYSIPMANVWTKVKYTFPCDTTGTWEKENLTGLDVLFDLGTGATFRGTANAWAGSNFVGVTGSVSPMETSGATWQVTGVQLEPGPVATPFERRPIGTELALCQRYFANSTAYGWGYAAAGGANRVASPYLPVTMRLVPTIIFTSGSGVNVSGATAEGIGVNQFGVATTVSAAGGYFINLTFTATAEL